MGIRSAYVICEIPEADADEGFPNKEGFLEDGLPFWGKIILFPGLG